MLTLYKQLPSEIYFSICHLVTKGTFKRVPISHLTNCTNESRKCKSTQRKRTTESEIHYLMRLQIFHWHFGCTCLTLLRGVHEVFNWNDLTEIERWKPFSPIIHHTAVTFIWKGRVATEVLADQKMAGEDRYWTGEVHLETLRFSKLDYKKARFSDSYHVSDVN